MRSRHGLVLGRNGIVCGGFDGSPGSGTLVRGSITDAGSAQSAMASLAGQIDSRAVRSAVLGDDMVRYFLVTPPEGARRLQELQAAAEIRFESIFSTQSSDWQLAAEWHASRPFFCCATPRYLMKSLTGQFPKCRSVSPLFARALGQLRSATQRARLHGVWVVCDTDQWITAAHFIDDRCSTVRSIARAQVPQLESWLATESFLCGHPSSTTVVLSGAESPFISALNQLALPAAPAP